jgi:hypothetical protein
MREEGLYHVPTPRGSVGVGLSSEAEVAKLRAYQAALRTWVESGDRRPLETLAGQELVSSDGGRFPLITRPAVLLPLARAGELAFDWSAP